ncbi:DUF6932 family protein [Yinghuangia sp. YIM S10712]|uniref:DUF6932 family protein n=1 Tax=Yinghuangia sp. YIM S10712 TaxID=3436930 RepID=UPI003F532DCB
MLLSAYGQRWSTWSRMPLLPAFSPVTLCPPPGRYAMTWQEVEAELVWGAAFASSRTRSALWEELGAHREIVGCLFGGVDRIWLAGSFVSAKLDPSDVDLAYLINPQAYDAIAADPDSIDDLDNLGTREWCVKQGMRVDAYILRLPATSDFKALGVRGAMASGDDEVFRKLGLYDEIWQRCTVDGTEARRGYVEVSL